MESKPKERLIRIAFDDGRIKADPDGKANGRGAYICPSMECFEKAEKKRAFNRAFRSAIDPESMEAAKADISKYIESKAVKGD